MSYLIKRRGVYYYYRRVPRDVSDLDPRVHVKVTLKTENPDIAEMRSSAVNQVTEEFWNDLILEAVDDPHEKYKKALRRARALGFRRAPGLKVRGSDLAEVPSPEALREMRQSSETSDDGAEGFGIRQSDIEKTGGDLTAIIQRIKALRQNDG